MKRTRILVVDDEVNIVRFITSTLRAAGYDALSASDGEQALAVADDQPLDLVILDLMMPGIDGLEVCRRLRSTSEVPIIVLSAKDEESDKVDALNFGADDYLTKPFGVPELLARVGAVLRRTCQPVLDAGPRVLVQGPLLLDPGTRRLTVSGRTQTLTRTEFDLLHFLMRHAGKVVPHNLLLGEVWGPEYRNQTEYLHVYIGRLRQKIEPDQAHPRYLLTVAGLGYILQPNPLPLS